MRVAVAATFLFGAAFAVHLIVWRIRVPRRQSAALLVIFLGSLVAGLVTLRCSDTGNPRRWGFWACGHIAEFHIAMSLAYVVFYSAIEEPSPTLTVMTCVAQTRAQGRTRAEIFEVLTEAVSVENRLGALIRDKMLLQANGAYRLTGKGRMWAKSFKAWRRLCALPTGG